MFTKSNYPTLFIARDTQLQEVPHSPYSIILSPELYWVKRLNLPVKYLREVKKLLPSIFEDILPEGNYSYHVYKEQNSYIAFAYEDEKILKLLEAKGYNTSLLQEVYFFQSLQEPKQNMLLLQNNTLMFKDGIWITLPDGWVTNAIPCDIEALSFKEPIRLSNFTHSIDKDLLVRVSSLLLGFSALFFIQSFLLSSQNSVTEEQKVKVFQEYGLKATTMQNESMLKNYLTTHERQMVLRQVSAKILSLKLPSNSFITSYEIKADKVYVTFQTAAAKELLALLQESTLTYTSQTKEQSLLIEVAL